MLVTAGSGDADGGGGDGAVVGAAVGAAVVGAAVVGAAVGGGILPSAAASFSTSAVTAPGGGGGCADGGGGGAFSSYTVVSGQRRGATLSLARLKKQVEVYVGSSFVRVMLLAHGLQIPLRPLLTYSTAVHLGTELQRI